MELFGIIAILKGPKDRSAMTVSAHFDGNVVVPDEPLNLPANQAVRVHIESLESEP